MAIWDRKPKTQNVQQEENISSPDKNNSTDDKSKFINPVSKIIRPEIMSFVIHEMDTWNIPYEVYENGNSYKLVIEKQDVDEVDGIIEDGEKDYYERISQSDEKDNNKKSLTDKVGGAETRIEKKEQQKTKVFQKVINPEFEDLFGDMLLQVGVKQFQFKDWNDKRIIIFYEKDIPLINSIYEKLLEQVLKTEEEETKKSEEDSKPESSKDKKKPTKKVLGRTEQIMTRFTPEEMKIVHERIEKSGKRQGDFVREMLLDGYVKAFPTHANDLTIIQELQNLQSQLGKLSGAIVKIMQETKENSVLTEEERSNLQREINGLKKLRSEIRKEVKELWH